MGLYFQVALGIAHQHTDPPHPVRLLPPRRERPCCRRAEQRDNLAPFHHCNHSIPAIRETGVTEYWIGTAASVCLDVGRPNDLCPFFGLVGDELGEVGGGAPKRY